MADAKDPALPTKTMRAPDFQAMWRDTADWFAVHYMQILIAIGAAIVIYLLLATLKGLGKRYKGSRGDTIGYTNVLGRTVSKTTHFFMVMVSARLVAGYADAPPVVYRTIVFLFTIATVLQGAIWAREVILGLIERRTLAEDGQGETLANAMGLIRVLVTVALFAIAGIVVLDNLGVNVTGLVAGLGIGGIAIGLAAQGIFSDLFAALSIIFDKPFRRGESISYDTTTATVEKIGLKSTRLRALTGEKKVISNANLLQKEITSYHTLDHRRLKFAIGVIYQTAPDVAEQIPDILKGIVDDLGGTFVRSGFVGFGASSLDFELEFEVYLPGWDDIYKIRHNIGLAILRQFNERGIEFAYPTQTTFTAAPDGRMIMPYAEVQPVKRVDLEG
ncbi:MULTISPECIES: mechanosensitive ion channel family protein [Sphingobium]|jgi:small-conductance mechanosensitive channel|uniref:mechanosensitive ion channel family protein n=1 Tax=Sphingobium TaxID=165695 RepID=UPI000C5A5283|nr:MULTISPECIES: mechanosensitive ion channel domain-containing protein [Sphingobium]MAX15736.1 mechanosensitive ion channel protein MscS [Sphingobium sp.]MCC4255817.1 mechanosensitive ion channel family protein [Sphingobium lactosutens]MEE2740598.1 mechanosensitive ion channel domain-containing protein [Pseudomonadota bacterium]|tara:strand:- start:1615 stop:2781 length:1167 start_codon:yes stop_codon:yes gene_type:complete